MNLANPPYALHALPWIILRTLYSLLSFWFLWTYIFIGTPCYVSNWLVWYDWMNGTTLFFAKYLGFFFKKISSIASLLKLMKIPTRAKVWASCKTLCPCSLSLLWALSNSMTHVRNFSYFPWSRSRTRPLTHYASILEDSKHFHPPQNKTPSHTMTPSLSKVTIRDVGYTKRNKRCIPK